MGGRRGARVGAHSEAAGRDGGAGAAPGQLGAPRRSVPAGGRGAHGRRDCCALVSGSGWHQARAAAHPVRLNAHAVSLFSRKESSHLNAMADRQWGNLFVLHQHGLHRQALGWLLFCTALLASLGQKGHVLSCKLRIMLSDLCIP